MAVLNLNTTEYFIIQPTVNREMFIFSILMLGIYIYYLYDY